MCKMTCEYFVKEYCTRTRMCPTILYCTVLYAHMSEDEHVVRIGRAVGMYIYGSRVFYNGTVGASE